MGYPSNPVVTGAISLSDVTDLYATHWDILGLGGHRSVDTISDRDAITTLRRKFGMLVTVNADPTPSNNKVYMLANVALGGTNGTLSDNVNWIEFSSGGGTYTAGSAITLTGTVFKAGGLLTEDVSYTGDNTYAFNFGSGASRLSGLSIYSNNNIYTDILGDFHTYEVYNNGVNARIKQTVETTGMKGVFDMKTNTGMFWNFVNNTDGYEAILSTGTNGSIGLESYDNNLGKFASITLRPDSANKIVVLNNYTGGSGMVYAADYTTGLIPLSLIHKGYADGKFIAGSTGVIDNRVLRADGTGGLTAQSSVWSIDDTGNVIVNALEFALVTQAAGSSIVLNDTNGIFYTSSLHRLTSFTNVTNTVRNFVHRHQTSATPAVGIGSGISFEVETAGDNYEIGAKIEAVSTNVTPTTEEFDLVFSTMSAGSAAVARLTLGRLISIDGPDGIQMESTGASVTFAGTGVNISSSTTDIDIISADSINLTGYIVTTLPTSAVGLESGTFWNNLGVVNVAP
jgi:hypothetical protein